jgi:hypothetical protein
MIGNPDCSGQPAIAHLSRSLGSDPSRQLGSENGRQRAHRFRLLIPALQLDREYTRTPHGRHQRNHQGSTGSIAAKWFA